MGKNIQVIKQMWIRKMLKLTTTRISVYYKYLRKWEELITMDDYNLIS